MAGAILNFSNKMRAFKISAAVDEMSYLNVLLSLDPCQDIAIALFLIRS